MVQDSYSLKTDSKVKRLVLVRWNCFGKKTINSRFPLTMGVFGLSLFLLKLKTETENTVAK